MKRSGVPGNEDLRAKRIGVPEFVIVDRNEFWTDEKVAVEREPRAVRVAQNFRHVGHRDPTDRLICRQRTDAVENVAGTDQVHDVLLT